jgi:hypothetical protein
MAILTRLASDGEPLDVELERAARVLVSATAPDGLVVIESNDPTAVVIAQAFAGTVLVVPAAGAAWAGPVDGIAARIESALRKSG